MKFTLKEIGAARMKALRLPLHGRFLLLRCSDALIMDVCNGIGPEWFPTSVRTLIDKMHPSLKIVAMLHDLEYFFGKGKAEEFNQLNNAFKTNGYMIAKDSFGWYNPRRYVVEFDAAKFAKCCDLGGRFAYYAAIEQRRDCKFEEAPGIYDIWSKLEDDERNII